MQNRIMYKESLKKTLPKLVLSESRRSKSTVYNLAMSRLKGSSFHNIVCFPAKPKNDIDDYSMFESAHIVATIPARWNLYPSYMHSFGITENYFIIVEQPLNISAPKVLLNKLITNDPIAGAFTWFKDEMVQINIISRKTGELTQKFYSKSFFYFHIINQYESSDHIVLDLCSYEDGALLDCFYTEAVKNMQSKSNFSKLMRSRPIRFVLQLNIEEKSDTSVEENLLNFPNTKAEAHFLPDGNILVTPELLCDINCELPRINYDKYSGKEYQFFYAAATDVDSEHPGQIIKVDTINKTKLTWSEKNCYPSEPIFVPKPNSQAEDDGIVLVAILWGGDNENRIGLVILDAKTLSELGRSEFQTPGPVPKCFHGWFSPQ